MTRAIVALGLSVYAWAMMGVQLYLRGSASGEPIAVFRRETMGRAVLILGACALVAAVTLALTSKPRKAPVALAALALGVGWVVCLWNIWPV